MHFIIPLKVTGMDGVKRAFLIVGLVIEIALSTNSVLFFVTESPVTSLCGHLRCDVGLKAAEKQ